MGRLNEQKLQALLKENKPVRYTDFGDDPFIVAPPDVPKVDFSAWHYAREKAEEMCAGKKPE